MLTKSAFNLALNKHWANERPRRALADRIGEALFVLFVLSLTLPWSV